MTKKKGKKMKKKPHPDLHHFTMLVKYTERAIKNDGSEVDEFFKNQAIRLKKQLKGLG